MAKHNSITIPITWLHLLLIAVIIIGAGTILYMGVNVYLRASAYEDKIDQRIETRDLILKTTLINPIEISPKDSTEISGHYAEELLERMQKLEESQSEYLADLRQESNNIINKYNGWLTVWIMILTFLMGIIPLGLQYLLRKQSRKEVEIMMEEVEKKAISHQLSLMVSGVYIERECGAVGDDSTRPELMNKLITETNLLFDKLMVIIDNSQGYLDTESEIYLINCLVQYSRLIDILKRNAKGRGVRDLNRLHDKVKVLISDIIRHERNSREKVWNRILDLRQELKELRWRDKD